MKSYIFLVLLVFFFCSTAAAQEQKASLLDGLLNVAEWVENFNSTIESIDNRESLKRLNRELSYLSTDINEITSSKKRLVFEVTKPNATVQDYAAEVEYLQESMRIFQSRFQEINRLIPAEFKVEENPLTHNIDKLIWQKMETLETIKNALYGEETKESEIMLEVNKAIEITKDIELEINAIKLQIEEKLTL